MFLIGNDRNFIGSVHSVLLLRIYYTFWEGQKKGNDQVMIEYNVAIQAIAEKKNWVYLMVYLTSKKLFTGQKNGTKLAKVHFGQQLQFSFSIHNSDHVWESFDRKLFQSLLRALKSLSRPEWSGKTTFKLSTLAIKTVRELRGLEAKHLFYDIIRITRHGSRF